MLYKSKELRWFKKSLDKPVLNWFKKRNITFENTGTRTDYYLMLSGREDLNIKMREGNIELKQRVSQPEKMELIEGVTGSFENWEKWSFELSSVNSVTGFINQAGDNRWIALNKCRLGVKFVQDGKSKTRILDINEPVSLGCQLEYTRIKVNEDLWYTFNLEWFGDDWIDPGAEVFYELLGSTKLTEFNSMSYAGFINRYLTP